MRGMPYATMMLLLLHGACRLLLPSSHMLFERVRVIFADAADARCALRVDMR